MEEILKKKTVSEFQMNSCSDGTCSIFHESVIVWALGYKPVSG